MSSMIIDVAVVVDDVVVYHAYTTKFKKKQQAYFPAHVKTRNISPFISNCVWKEKISISNGEAAPVSVQSLYSSDTEQFYAAPLSIDWDT